MKYLLLIYQNPAAWPTLRAWTAPARRSSSRRLCTCQRPCPGCQRARNIRSGCIHGKGS